MRAVQIVAYAAIVSVLKVNGFTSLKAARLNTRLYESAAPSEAPSKHVVVIGAGWGGLSAAHHISKKDSSAKVTVVEAAGRVGGVVRDGYRSVSGKRPAEAGQHGFWNNYHNIYTLFDELGIRESALTDYAPQGQYSPNGLEAVWPVYNQQVPNLPTGLAQAAYTKFLNLSLLDRATALPLVLAFSEFDNSPEAWKKYDQVSFRDLCSRLGVSKKLYDEAFEPMILTGLFAPGGECSAAAALGMAYFFVLQSQTAFDVQWCRGNIGKKIFDPWVDLLKQNGVNFETSTRVQGFDIDPKSNAITTVKCQRDGESLELEADTVVFAVGAEALKAFGKFCPELSVYTEFRNFANLRGTSVLATRIYLDRTVPVPYTANACWGFDESIGMTLFDIGALHGEPESDSDAAAPGSILEVDYYHASPLLTMDDDAIIAKVKKDLDTILGADCVAASVEDAAIVRLDNGVNWYFPGSYQDMPRMKSASIGNAYFCGDIVKTEHGSWSQEKAYVTGMEVANLVVEKPVSSQVIPVAADEPHVAFGREIVKSFRSALRQANLPVPSLVGFLER